MEARPQQLAPPPGAKQTISGCGRQRKESSCQHDSVASAAEINVGTTLQMAWAVHVHQGRACPSMMEL